MDQGQPLSENKRRSIKKETNPNRSRGHETVKLRVILPLQYNEFLKNIVSSFYREFLRENTDVSVSFLTPGPNMFTTSEYDLAYGARNILEAVQAAEKDGCDGVYIDVAFDTGLAAAKSIVNIPVVGALQSMLAMGSNIFHRFSIIAVSEEEIAPDHRLVRDYGFSEQLVSVESINIYPLELNNDVEETYRQCLLAGQRAIEKGADALILGCTGIINVSEKLQKELGCPVLHGSIVGLYTLEDLVRLRLMQSRKWYIPPRNKRELPDETYAQLRALTFDLKPGKARREHKKKPSSLILAPTSEFN